jgi:hypothetical protein
MLVIPYLFSPMGNPISIGAAALHPSLQRNWRRLIHRLQAARAARCTWQRALESLWNFPDIAEIAPADHADDDGLSDLEFQISLAYLLLL